MYQLDEARSAVRVRTEPNHYGFRKEPFDPRPSTRRSEVGRPGVRLRIVPAPGGVAFVEVEPATGRT